MARKETPKLPKREDMEALVKEINDVLQPEKPLTIGKKMSDEDLAEMIRKECKGNIFTTDFEEDPKDADRVIFTEDAKADFEALGIEIVDPPEDVEEEEVNEEPAKGEKGKAGKGKGKEEPAKGKEKEKAKPAAKSKDKPKKKDKEPRYTRDQAVHAAIEELCKKKDGADFKTIMNRSDAIYVENGGRSTPDAVNVNKYTLNGLVAFEVLTLKDGMYKFK